MREWAGLVSTLVLVGVTAWYAYLTHRLARSSERAAVAAESAARTSASALALQRASAEVDFVVSSVPPGVKFSDDPSRLKKLELRALGASAWIHSLQLLAVGKRSGGSTTWLEIPKCPELLREKTILHRGESLEIDVRQGVINVPAQHRCDQLALNVNWSVEESDEPLRYRAVLTCP